MKKRKILFAAFEAVPFIKTGGLGDVAGSLPPALCDGENEVRVVLPRLASLPEEFAQKLRFIKSFTVPLSWRNQYCGLFELKYNGVRWYFLDNEYYFGRPMPYGYFDDGERMAFFAKAVCECMVHLPSFFPDVLHCNDWHSALAAVFLREQYRGMVNYERVRTVMTIHNLKFQGVYDAYNLGDILGLSGSQAAREQLCADGNLNYLRGAVCYADRLTTVSPGYAEEICTAEFGEGLQEIFRRRRSVLSGILNGIDNAAYDPAGDPALAENYSDPAGKAANKRALQALLGLREEPDTPLFVMVSRLTEQKGVDLLCALLPRLRERKLQLAVLGTGDCELEQTLTLAALDSNGSMATRIEFSEKLSRLFYAGGDVLLMPSRFEPCGLSQMIAMRYGTVPLVRATGGLRDSVTEYAGEGGTGFCFEDCTPEALLAAMERAVQVYGDAAAWRALTERDMAERFGWERSAASYRDIYRELCS
ncbi:MAG: glycogen synthase [Oscillospiraceae bacterium]|nr:glycogen synthase [Oscillospiraceae bacterium]